jgi:hypothetical protein
MTNSKNVVEQIKSLMVQFGFMNEEVTLLSFKLSDDTIVELESLEVGKSIMKINEGFEKVSLENGSYRLSNFEVQVQDGLIKSVKELFVEAKLVDGTVIKVEGDSLLEGAKVVVVQGDAEVVAPDGVHELETGEKVETKDGMIVSVQEKEVEAPEVEIPVAAASQPPSMENEIMQMLQDFVKKIGEKMSVMEQNYNTLQNEFNQFKKEPASKKITDGKTDYKFNVENGELNNKIKAIMALRNK